MVLMADMVIDTSIDLIVVGDSCFVLCVCEFISSEICASRRFLASFLSVQD